MADCTINAYIKWSRYSQTSSRIWNNNHLRCKCMCVRVLDCAYMCVLIVFILNLILVFLFFEYSSQNLTKLWVFSLVPIKSHDQRLSIRTASRTHFSAYEMKNKCRCGKMSEKFEKIAWPGVLYLFKLLVINVCHSRPEGATLIPLLCVPAFPF